MGYLAHYDSGKWRGRYNAINRLPLKYQRTFASQERAALKQMEQELARLFRLFFTSSAPGRLITKVAREAGLNNYKWRLTLSSITYDFTHKLVELQALPKQITFASRLTSLARRCPECLGRRFRNIPPFQAGEKVTSSLTLKRYQSTPGYLGENPNSISAEALTANKRIKWVIDKARGQGLLDAPMKAIEKGIWRMPTKHLLFYCIPMTISLETSAQEFIAEIGELSPIARYQTTSGDAVTSQWEMTPDTDFWKWPLPYWQPCRKCQGSGIVHFGGASQKL